MLTANAEVSMKFEFSNVNMQVVVKDRTGLSQIESNVNDCIKG